MSIGEVILVPPGLNIAAGEVTRMPPGLKISAGSRASCSVMLTARGDGGWRGGDGGRSSK